VLFVAGLMAIEDGGLCASAQAPEGAPFYHDAAYAQMLDIVAKAGKIFAAAGTDLAHVVRALHFHADLSCFRSGFMAWHKNLRLAGLPFSAIEAGPELFLPGAAVILDLWGHVPPA
jgi:hypothetical protein